MKKILNISGVKKLDRQDLKNIKGGQCFDQDGLCCRVLSDGSTRCALGECRGGRFCVFFPNP
ncbi:hypothetical protein [Ascidiimonas aurantiaca]|uniref:hypothetical protein n=1 Tax=Ascidiimonas aurantiaca TaxID=1685432 RepID=UPI0030EE4125